MHSKYAKRRIALGDEVGPVQLRCEVADPESRRLADGKLSLIRVHPVEVAPPFQVAYIHRENTKSYKVLFGSGSFGDSMNDTRVAEVRFFSEKRYELAPLREGFLRFTISDNKTYRGAKASAVLLVSDVVAIELTGGGDIQEGDEMVLYVDTFDLQYNRFEESEVLLMDLVLEVHKGAPEGLRWRREFINNMTVFVVKGLEPGLYDVTASIKRKDNGRKIRSEVVSINVFENVQIVPETLLLYPGSSWTVQRVGGPVADRDFFCYLHFSIRDSHIAEIDRNHVIHAKELGDTVIEAVIWTTIKHRNASHMAFEERKVKVAATAAHIRVREITNVEIFHVSESTHFASSVYRLNSQLKHHEEIFLPALGQTYYSWSVEAPEMLTLMYPQAAEIERSDDAANAVKRVRIPLKRHESEYSSLQNFETRFNYSAIFVEAQKQGTAPVRVKFAVQYPPKYRD